MHIMWLESLSLPYVWVNAVLSIKYISIFLIFSCGWTANELISLFLCDCVCKWNHNYVTISDLLELIPLLPHTQQERPLSLEKFCFIRRVKSSKFSPGIQNMNRVHGKLINTANPLDLFQLCVPARMMWDMQLTKASDWLTPHPLVSLPASIGSQSNPPADICALTIWGPRVWCNAGLLYVFANYWDSLLLLEEFGSRSHSDNKWELIRVNDEKRHKHKCWTTCTLNGYLAPVDRHFHFSSAYFNICHLQVFYTSFTRPNKSVFFKSCGCFPAQESCFFQKWPEAIRLL